MLIGEWRHRGYVSSGPFFYITDGVRAFCSCATRRHPFNLPPSCHFQTSPLRKKKKPESAERRPRPQHSHHMPGTRCRNPPVRQLPGAFSRLALGSDLHLDATRIIAGLITSLFPHLRITAARAADVGTPFGSDRAAITAQNEATGGMARPLGPPTPPPPSPNPRHPLFRRSAICLREAARPQRSSSLPSRRPVSLRTTRRHQSSRNLLTNEGEKMKSGERDGLLFPDVLHLCVLASFLLTEQAGEARLERSPSACVDAVQATVNRALKPRM